MTTKSDSASSGLVAIRAAVEAAQPEALAPFEAIAHEPPDVRRNKTRSWGNRVYRFRQAANPTTVLALLNVAEAALEWVDKSGGYSRLVAQEPSRSDQEEAWTDRLDRVVQQERRAFIGLKDALAALNEVSKGE